MSKVAFILGGGPRVGNAVANHLDSTGYKVAIGRRSPSSDGLHSSVKTIKLDLASTGSIVSAFAEVKTSFGAFPNVVIYNGGNLEKASPPDDIFALDVELLRKDGELNIWGPYQALQEATKGWKTLPEDPAQPKVFIMTGNILPFAPIPVLLSLGIGKTASAHMVESATLTEEFQKDNWRFYFATGTTADGGPVYRDLDGPAHAKAYEEMIDRKEQGPWDVRFVAHVPS
jgi:NAD(P)-dependent dehydrogenase (short-subunit alcohol dehydrogenase family)